MGFVQRQHAADLEAVGQHAGPVEQEDARQTHAPVRARANHRHPRPQHPRGCAGVGGLRAYDGRAGIDQQQRLEGPGEGAGK